MTIRRALPQEIEKIYDLIEIAGDARPSSKDGGFVVSNSWVISSYRSVDAVLFGYPMSGTCGLDLPQCLRPVMTPESASACFYVNTVAAFARGRGFGGRLMDFADQACRDLGCSGVGLEINADEPFLRDFYGRRGFEEVRLRRSGDGDVILPAPYDKDIAFLFKKIR